MRKLKVALCFVENAPSHYIVTDGTWGAPALARIYGTEAQAQRVADALGEDKVREALDIAVRYIPDGCIPMDDARTITDAMADR